MSRVSHGKSTTTAWIVTCYEVATQICDIPSATTLIEEVSDGPLTLGSQYSQGTDCNSTSRPELSECWTVLMSTPNPTRPPPPILDAEALLSFTKGNCVPDPHPVNCSRGTEVARWYETKFLVAAVAFPADLADLSAGSIGV